ncbi:MAG TPA: immunoglobulin domain-containing protein [Verrucomicrobiae bacterium]
MSYNSENGQFTNVVLPALGPFQYWQFSLSGSTGLLQIVSNTNSTYQITGSVTDSQGNGITNISVFATTTNASNTQLFTANTGSTGAYSMNVPNGIFQVGLQGLPHRGYAPITNQTVVVNNSSQAANFVLEPYDGQLYTVTGTVTPSGAGSISGAGPYPQGSIATVSAIPAAGPLPYWFENWSENGAVLTTNNSYTFLVNAPYSLVANFVWPSPVITVQPQSQTVVAGASATLSISVTGAQPMNYQWQFSGTNLVDGGQITGSQSNILTIANSQPGKAGDYQVSVANAYGGTNSDVAAVSITQPINTLFNTGVNTQGAPLTNGTIGDPHYALVSVPSETNAIQVLDFSAWLPADTNSAWIGPDNDSEDSGPVGNYDYQTTFVIAGDPATATIAGQCAADNQLNGIYLNGQFTGIASSEGFSEWQPFTLSGLTNNFVYGTNTLDFIVYNSSGPTGLRLEMTGMVATAVGPPVIVAQPISRSPAIDATAQFSVGAVGSEPLSYQWQLNGANLSDNGSISGSQSNLLTIPNVQVAETGNFQVVVTNSAGSVTSTVATLTVGIIPNITTQPQNQSVGLDGTAVFNVGVSGTGPFYYQWLFDGQPLPDANGSTLTLPNVQTSNQGQYSVAVVSDYGSAVSSTATLSVLGYCATAQSSQPIYPMGNAVPITVQTLVCDSHTAAPNQIATVWISNNGFIRSLPATTGNSGSTVVDFVPLPTEAGFYQIAASLPGQAIPTAQSSFTLAGLALSTNHITTQVTSGQTQTNIVILTNLTSVDLTALSATVIGSTPDVSVQLNVQGTLSGNVTGQLDCVLTALDNGPAQNQCEILLTTAQGTTNLVSVTATVAPSVPQLTVTPSPLNTSMVQGTQTLVNFWMANIGGATSGPVSVILPQEPWLTPVTPQPMPPLSPGQSNQVTLELSPSSSLTLGAYTGSFDLTSSNVQLSVPFTFDCISTAVGALQVIVQDDLTDYSPGAPNVSNATITVSDFQSGEQVTNAITDASGIVLFTNLTSDYYTVSITAPDHGAFSTTLLVSPGVTNDLTAFLPLQLVDYTWMVMPTEVPDEYQFTLNATFATQVPWPVVTVNPAAIDLCDIQGDSTQVDLTITNSGLIAADGLNLYFGPHPDWLIQPLVSSLGTLLPQSNMIVPVSITRIGISNDVPSQVPAQLSYYVPALNETNYNVVPLYFYHANPENCEPGPSPPPQPDTCIDCLGSLDGGGGGSGIAPIITAPSYNLQLPQGALVEVKLQIDQTAVISRDGFHATLELQNNAGDTVSNLQVSITVYDSSNNVANNLFGITAPTLSGLNAVDGTGVMANGAAGQAIWTIVPATNAAPQATTQFSIGGTLSYTLNGEPVTIPFFAVPVTVLPCPIFTVDYFLQHDVYSQDPFVSQYEPPIPFALGIIVKNNGYGSANDFSITSAQPKIVANSNDLLITFSLIGSQIGTNESVSPSFTLDFGDIGPKSSGDGLWYLTSSLDGQFVAFDASFRHVDDFDNTNTSLISGVNTYEMNHVVRLPADNGLPDYLVNDTTNIDALPDVVFASDGSTSPVTSLSVSDTTTIGSPSSPGQSVALEITNTPVPSGWVYLEAIDPSAGSYPIVGVKRSDGTSLIVGPNVWQTPQRADLVPPQTNYLIHIFDDNPTGAYTVTYGQPVGEPTNYTLAATQITPTTAVLNADVYPNGGDTRVYFEWGTTTNYQFTTENTYADDLYTFQDMDLGLNGLQPHTVYHYQAVAINGLGTVYGGDSTFETLTNPPPTIPQVTNQFIADGEYLIITNHVVAAAYPLTFGLANFAPEGATISTNGIFRWQPACDQGSSNYTITVFATDSSTPPLTSSMTFSVAVGECVQVAIGSTAVQVGQTGAVPVTLVSSIPLTNLSLIVINPSSRLINWAFASSNSSIQNPTFQLLDSSNVYLNVKTITGQTLDSQPLLGTIYFTPGPGPSEFLPLVGSNILGTASDGTVAGDVNSLSGRVAVIAAEPLIEAGLGSNSSRTLILYGNPGTNYELTFTTNLLSPNWQIWSNFKMTNLFQPLQPNQTSPQVFYRALSQP